MNATAELKTVSLYYREGSSDKEYHVRLEESGAGFLVNFSYGRRGSALSTGTKTTSPVSFDAAEKLFDKLVKEKKAKGYREGESGTPYQQPDQNHESDLHPQLLNSVEEPEVERLLDDPDWFMQEKLDGRRMLLEKDGRMIIPINKKGFAISAPLTILQSAERLKGSCVVDGEHIGDYLYVFDLLELNGEDLRSQPFEQRYIALLNLIAGSHTRHIQIVQCFTTAKDKRAWLNTLRLKKAEGVVFKDKRAAYVAGKPNSGGTQLKHKFVASLSAVVTVINPQRSVTVSLLDTDTGWHPIGNVTIPANHKVPACGTVVEVRYLYAFTQSRKLFQPVYLGTRSDVTQVECVIDQLKFKADEEEP